MNKEEKIARIQSLEQQAAEVQLRAEEVGRAIAENQLTLAALGELAKNTSSFSAIGSGVYVKTRVEDDKNVLVSVGEEIMIECPVEKARERLEKAGKDLEENLEQLTAVYSRIMQEYSKLLKEEGA